MNNFWKSRKIFLTITTGLRWREKIEKIKEIKLEEVSLFLTFLKEKERKELYELVRKTSIKEVPFVHIRSDMELWELDYLVKNYKTQVFNIHTRSEYPLNKDHLKYKNIIYIENVYNPLNEEEIKDFGGICLDLAHLENDRMTDKGKFEHNIKILRKYPIGCNHIGSIRDAIRIDEKGFTRHDDHYIRYLSEMDYLKKYPSKYFSPFIAIELEDNIKRQLEVKEYVINLLKDK